ncbi:MAG: D-alanine--D-alanine ligase [Luteibaculaceae bacterium]
MSKPNVAVLFGGFSGEAVVSEKSAKNVFNAVPKDEYSAYLVQITKEHWYVLFENDLVEIDKTNFSFTPENGSQIKFDFVLNVIHGSPGEDGLLQGYFEMLSIPHSTGNALSCALTFNKLTTNIMLRNAGFKTGSTERINKKDLGDLNRFKSLGLPLFIKPCETGSSIGISKVKDWSELEGAIKNAFQFDDEVLVEPYVSGRELSCGVVKIGNSEPIALPPTEIIPQNEFFDFESKYSGKSQEITPASLTTEQMHIVQEAAVAVYNLFNCYGFARVDIFLLSDNSVHIIEPNIVPGMTNESLIPQQLRAAGLDLTQLLSQLIQAGIQKS